MMVVCAVAAEDAADLAPDILVLPEGITALALTEAVERFPEAMIVAACSDKTNMRAHVLVGGRNQVDYLKVLDDGRSEGTGEQPTSVPFCEWRDCAIGVAICRDIEPGGVLPQVLQALRDSSRSTKLLCIPADMHGGWFPSDPVLGFEGVYVAMSNNNITYPDWRATSLIAAPDGRRISTQCQFEPIVATIGVCDTKLTPSI